MSKRNIKEVECQMEHGQVKQRFTHKKIGKFTLSMLVGLSLAGAYGGMSASAEELDDTLNEDVNPANELPVESVSEQVEAPIVEEQVAEEKQPTQKASDTVGEVELFDELPSGADFMSTEEESELEVTENDVTGEDQSSQLDNSAQGASSREANQLLDGTHQGGSSGTQGSEGHVGIDSTVTIDGVAVDDVRSEDFEIRLSKSSAND